MTVKFDHPVASVLSLLNYAPVGGSSSIAVYDAMNRLIESFTLNIATTNALNAVAFFGFAESSNTIRSIRFGDQYVVARDITTAAAAGPVPGTLSSLGLGIAALVAMGGRRKAARGRTPSMGAAA